FGHDPDDVLGQAATGDVGHGVDRAAMPAAQQGQHRLDVQRGGRHQRVDQLHPADVEIGRTAGAIVDAADQRITIGVRATGGDADEYVAGAHLRAVEQLRLLHRADGETGQVVLARWVHVRHFRGLAADQCTAGQFAAARDAADDGHGGIDVELAGGEVVEEEQRFGTLYQHVVHAHADQVDADRVVAAELLGQLELGADAVGAGHQHRLAVFAGQVEQGAEAAEAAHHFGPEAAPDQRLDAFDHFVARVDVDAGVTIGEGCGRGRLGRGHGWVVPVETVILAVPTDG